MIAVAALVLGLFASMYIRMNRMENRYMQAVQSQQGGLDKAGRPADPYLNGPVKNTVVKHSGEILSCYREYLERNKNSTDPNILKEGPVIMDWQVDEDGTVVSPAVVRSGFQDALFHSCLIKKISAWRFPEPPFGVKKYVEHTFKFQDDENGKK